MNSEGHGRSSSRGNIHRFRVGGIDGRRAGWLHGPVNLQDLVSELLEIPETLLVLVEHPGRVEDEGGAFAGDPGVSQRLLCSPFPAAS